MGILKPRTATVVIYQGDDMERLGELRRAAEVAERQYEIARETADVAARGPRRGGDEIPSADAEKANRDEKRAAYDAAVDEAAERAVEVELTSIGRKRWRDLIAEHPPRTETVEGKEQTVEDDQLYEVNTETLPMALLTYNREDVRTVTIEGASSADVAEFLDDEVADGDFERLWQTAYWLNKSPGQDPRLGKYSAATPTLAEN